MQVFQKNLHVSELFLIFAAEQWTCSIIWEWGVPVRKSCQVRGDSFFMETLSAPQSFHPAEKY